MRKPAADELLALWCLYEGRTLVPLLQLLLIEVGRFLEIGELLLGELALAVVLHCQYLGLNMDALQGCPRSQRLLEGLEGGAKCLALLGLVARKVGLVVVGYMGVMETGELERRVLMLQQGQLATA